MNQNKGYFLAKSLTLSVNSTTFLVISAKKKHGKMRKNTQKLIIFVTDYIGGPTN